LAVATRNSVVCKEGLDGGSEPALTAFNGSELERGLRYKEREARA